MDDNVRFPKDKIEAKEDLIILLKTLIEIKENINQKNLSKPLLRNKCNYYFT